MKSYNTYLDYARDKENFFYSVNRKSYDKLEVYYQTSTYDNEKWESYNDGHWQYMMNIDHKFGSQGWKIHLTTHYDDASSMLYKVSEYLIGRGISFKYVMNKTILRQKNSKYADRSSSGKFITIYPRDEEQFISLLSPLKDITDDYLDGPYILNDKQWQCSNVFFRYGELKSTIKEIDGELCHVIKDERGSYVPDIRKPYYYLPDFIEEPAYIKNNNYFTEESEFDEFKKFEIINALHHSNAGGVYLISYKNKKYILKEGRKNCGIDNQGADGYTRIINEYRFLDKLKNVKNVIDVYKKIKIWNHVFIIEDYFEGESLQKFIAKEYPFNNNLEQVNNYAEKCKVIIKEIYKTIKQVHKENIAIGDLSLNNILVNENGKIKFIDLETAKIKKEPYKMAVATPGYISVDSDTYEQADWYGFYRIIRNLFLPVGPILDISPDIKLLHNQRIKKVFGREIIDFINTYEEEISIKVDIRGKSPFLNVPLQIPENKLTLNNIDDYINNLKRGILNNINSESFNLFKGNIEYIDDEINQLNISYGAFGVFMALVRSSDDYIPYMKNMCKKWLDYMIPYVIDVSKNDNTKLGLFNGIGGIVAVLHDLEYHKESKQIFNNILRKIISNINTYSKDLSLYSGISGLGLLILSSPKKGVYEYTILEMIYNIISDKYSQKKKEIHNEDFSLLYGWGGISLFLLEYGDKVRNDEILQLAVEIIDKGSSRDENNALSGLMLTSDNKLSPYLDNGSSGLGIVLQKFHEKINGFSTKKRVDLLNKVKSSNNLICSANGGLMRGFAGFLPLAIISNDKKQIEFLVDGLNSYFMKSTNSEIVFPGSYNLKCATNLYSGSAGVLLTLSALKEGEWSNWIPIYRGGLE